MLYVDKKRLEDVLSKKNISLNALANTCGVSRQSIYQMFEERSVFNTSFEKILKFLNCSHEDLVRKAGGIEEYVKSLPPFIRSTISELHAFAEKQDANLYVLFPSGKGRFGFLRDWTFDSSEHFPKRLRRKTQVMSKV